MSVILKNFSVFSVLLLLTAPVRAGDTGTAGAAFLKLGSGARAGGMGGAYSAVADEADALYWNPSGLVGVERPSLLLSYQPVVESVRYTQGALAFKTKRFAWGLGYSGVGQDAIDSYDDVGNKSGSYTASDSLTLLGFSFGNDWFSYGAAARYVSSKIDNVTASTVAGDLGLSFRNPLLMTLKHAFVARNLGGKLKFISQSDPLPQTFMIGNALELGTSFLIAADAGLVKGAGIQGALGAEWAPLKSRQLLALRAGYATSRQEAEKLAGFSLGAGFNFKTVSFDYAWVPYGELGTSHVVSLVWRIPKIEPLVRTKAEKKTKPKKGKVQPRSKSGRNILGAPDE